MSTWGSKEGIRMNKKLENMRLKLSGFTLIELMIVVGIIAILAAIAIPSYLSYVRRSYLSEATSSIAAIKSAEESYFTLNGCYTEAEPNPNAIPSGVQADWDQAPMPLGWGNNALAVRPDKRVRFQYQVYASNSLGCGTPANDAGAVDIALRTTGACIATNPVVGVNGFVNTTFFPEHWYIVVARGDLDGDPAVTSMIVSAIDDKAIVMCRELN